MQDESLWTLLFVYFVSPLWVFITAIVPSWYPQIISCKSSVTSKQFIYVFLIFFGTIDFMKVSSYGDGTESSGNISIDLDLSEDISGKCVLIVEDILDVFY